MAGANITIDLSTEPATKLLDAINRAKFLPSDWERMHHNVGEHLLGSVADRFRDQKDPKGQDWTPLSAATLKRRKRLKIKGTRILHQRGFLEMSPAFKATPTSVQVGSNLIYAALQQFGGTVIIKGRKIVVPARPFLGLSNADHEEISAIVGDRLNARLSGG